MFVLLNGHPVKSLFCYFDKVLLKNLLGKGDIHKNSMHYGGIYKAPERKEWCQEQESHWFTFIFILGKQRMNMKWRRLWNLQALSKWHISSVRSIFCILSKQVHDWEAKCSNVQARGGGIYSQSIKKLHTCSILFV